MLLLPITQCLRKMLKNVIVQNRSCENDRGGVNLFRRELIRLGLT
jgi:hypothetical protein